MDRVHTLANTEQFVYRYLDWIQSRIIFSTITVLGHRIYPTFLYPTNLVSGS
jgi:hypothetical protein